MEARTDNDSPPNEREPSPSGRSTNAPLLASVEDGAPEVLEADIVEVDDDSLEADGTIEKDEVVEGVGGVVDDVGASPSSASVVDGAELTAALVSPSPHDPTNSNAATQHSEKG
jgi:hypothetical protein